MELGVFLILFGDEFGCFILKVLLLEHCVDLDVVQETIETSCNDIIDLKENEKACEVLDQFEFGFLLSIIDWKHIKEQNWDRDTGDEETNAVDEIEESVLLTE